MSLRDKLEARARGEVSTAAVAAFGSGSRDAYDLLEQVPQDGPARAAAWCAFVYRTFGDELLSSGSAEGYASEASVAQAQVAYQLAADWLARARDAAADPGYQLDVSMPQPLPQLPHELDAQQLTAMRATLETLQARLGADVAALAPDDPARKRLEPSLEAVQSSLDTTAGAHTGGPELLPTLAGALHGGLDRAFNLGQLLAMPALLGSAHGDRPETPSRATAATVQVFRPGDPGFDPWCLTDPIKRGSRGESTESEAELVEFWRGDPEPEKTLTLQAAILAAVESGAADYLPPNTVGELEQIGDRCPWPGVMYAKHPVVVGETELHPGDCFILAAGREGDEFRRELLRLPAAAAAARIR
jgi:hypothetical protein